ncbi:ATP-binding protein [Novosphingopyxis iocasae]|uniref:ATP-binding protein n=1 Tax=Novosphingopyxis iocasae TaxID=2762729 RepID=UPI001650F53A|nr:ATP-binding protein [Novosphingopyxis iocasae]
MRLLSVSIENFRSYKDRVTVNIGDFTALMGRNDVGKSTILEALEVFFNNALVKIDQSDPCVHNESKIVEIGCVFDLYPEALTLDARSITTLEAEHLLNAHGHLEIVKRFKCTTKTPKEEVFARAKHPTAEPLADLLKLKNDALKARAREFNVDLAAGVDQRSNASLRGAIRATVGDADRAETLVPLTDEDGKKVWDQLQRNLPAFALFQADRPSKDDDPEIADPMKIAVAAAVREVEADLEAIKERVQRSAMEVAQRTLAKLQEMDPNLARQLTPSFKAEPKWDGFKLSLTGDDQIPINKRGSGVRRLILLNFFRAEAERKREGSNTQRVIYAVEEPESSQHPDNQIMLVKALIALADDPDTQVMMTTHVPAIAGMVPTDSVRFVTRDNDGYPQVEEGADGVLEKVAASLGVYPDKRAKVAVYVEGPHDVSFLGHVSKLYSAHDPALVDLTSDHRIAFIPTGGGNLKHWVERQYLANAGMIEVHIYDRDTQDNPKYGAHVDAVNSRGSRDIAFLTQRREMENYLHPAGIAAEFQYPAEPAFTDWCDVPALVAEHVHFTSGAANPWDQLDHEKQSKKQSRAKTRLNNAVASSMTLAQLREVDAGGEILGWFQAITERAA